MVQSRKETAIATARRLGVLLGLLGSAMSNAQQPAALLDDASHTAQQAARGAAIYQRDCALCHGAELRGAEAGPALIGAAFADRWNNRPTAEFLLQTRMTMPVTNPNGLGDEAYNDLVAFIIARNRQAPAAAVAAAPARTIQADWRAYHQDMNSTRYSPLDMINRDNVGKLAVVWRWSSANFGATPEFNYEVTPIMVDGVLYATAGRRRGVVAIDAVTGETLWMHRLDEGERGAKSPRINSGRGVAYWRDGADARILYVTPGYQLVALDAGTGQRVAGFGAGGIVDLKQGLDQDVAPTTPITLTSPPAVVGDIVIIGAVFGAGGSPPTKEGIAGHIRGYDIRTGERRWIFHTVPRPDEFGYDTWRNGSADYTGNTGAWAPMAADLARGLVYVPVEAPTGDFYGGHRPGDNLFSQSLVCLDAKTGQRVWHFQMIHHDVWDYDPPASPILAELTVDGRQIPAVIQITKQAFTFAFNRVTGEPIWPIEERPVPVAGGLAGEWLSPTQPFPTRPAPFDKQGVSADDLLDFTPEVLAEARRIASQMTMGPLFTPISRFEKDRHLGTLMVPGYGGGANWQGAAFDPELHILYVPSLTSPNLVGMGPDPSISNMDYVMLQRDVPGPFGLPLLRPPWGRITAIDMNRGEHMWMQANADAPAYVRNHEKLRGVKLPRTGHLDRGGLLVTRSLLFAGEGSGLYASRDGGRMLRAHDKLTGDIVAEFELPAKQTGLPMTYAIDGRQYIVVAVGAEAHPAEFVALSVPAETPKPADAPTAR